MEELKEMTGLLMALGFVVGFPVIAAVSIGLIVYLFKRIFTTTAGIARVAEEDKHYHPPDHPREKLWDRMEE